MQVIDFKEFKRRIRPPNFREIVIHAVIEDLPDSCVVCSNTHNGECSLYFTASEPYNICDNYEEIE